jgi:hypothetical protein
MGVGPCKRLRRVGLFAMCRPSVSGTCHVLLLVLWADSCFIHITAAFVWAGGAHFLAGLLSGFQCCVLIGMCDAGFSLWCWVICFAAFEPNLCLRAVEWQGLLFLEISQSHRSREISVVVRFQIHASICSNQGRSPQWYHRCAPSCLLLLGVSSVICDSVVYRAAAGVHADRTDWWRDSFAAVCFNHLA